jgi:L-methionine (R)-S-oxide reductase
MAETLLINTDRQHKAAIYQQVVQALQQLINKEQDETAVMAIAASVLQTTFGWHWTGFYRVQGDQLLVGPYQGPLACMYIPFGKGVCGTAWLRKETIVVPDVLAFPGHIACSSLTKSEIVVPLRDTGGEVRAVLDIDSVSPDDFDADDQVGLEQIAGLISGSIYP